jgi:membrane-associated protease RseP (regulator of RpoE activity)
VNLYNRVAGDETFAFSAVSWILKLFSLIALLSLGIGLANLLPIGPIDGGKMVQQALHKIRGEQRGNKTLAKLSIFLLIVVLLLLTPIIKETAKLVIG